ncbi:hypothetical protein OIO90_003683 [Microbotryomycetes sp. JL221]|nr:hypothetical protein OIO90_003683 [Microbotryomycetes sp. JL221]
MAAAVGSLPTTAMPAAPGASSELGRGVVPQHPFRSLPLPASTYEAVIITRQPSKSDPPLPSVGLLQQLVEQEAILTELGPLEGSTQLRRSSTTPSSRTSSSTSQRGRNDTKKVALNDHECSPKASQAETEKFGSSRDRGKTASGGLESRSQTHGDLEEQIEHSLTLQDGQRADEQGHSHRYTVGTSSVTGDATNLPQMLQPGHTSPRAQLSTTLNQSGKVSSTQRPTRARAPSDGAGRQRGPRSPQARQNPFVQSLTGYTPSSAPYDFANQQPPQHTRPRTNRFPSSGAPDGLGQEPFVHFSHHTASQHNYMAPVSYLAHPNYGDGSQTQFPPPSSPVSSHTFFSSSASPSFHAPSSVTSPSFASSVHDSSMGTDVDHFVDGYQGRPPHPHYIAQSSPYTYTHFTTLDSVSPQYGQQYIQFMTSAAPHFQLGTYPQQDPASFGMSTSPNRAAPPHLTQQSGLMSFAPQIPPFSSPYQYHALGLFSSPPPQPPLQGFHTSPASTTNMTSPQMRSPSAIPPPQIYAPPPELARGQLAQARFRDAVFGDQKRSGHGAGRGSALPKPPAHSPHALWVGNVPSDASHAELWRFFSTRTAPSSNPKYAERPSDLDESVDLNSTGIDSIHLINRSNCAFVNYASSIHLQHAIEVAHGVPLRGFDPRCKDLVCRERKKDEDTKSGVGAQRTGGMHKDFVRDRRRREATDEVVAGDELEELASPTLSQEDTSRQRDQEHFDVTSPPGKAVHTLRHSTSDTMRSVSTASTSSSFLRTHFEKRFFILKSHDENDLNLSVERGIWATQAHNEPVLDQAYRTAKEVFLIFGANRTGSFFGFARMASSIHSDSLSSSSGNSKAATSSVSRSSEESQPPTATNSFPRPATIAETEEAVSGSSSSSRESTLLFPEDRFTDMSPLPVPESDAPPSHAATSKTVRATGMVSVPPCPALDESTNEFAAASTSETLPATAAVAENLKLPIDKAVKSEPVSRGLTVDSSLLAVKEKAAIKSASDGAAGLRAAALQRMTGSSDQQPKVDDDGVWRKDTLPTPAERNARLEKIQDKTTEMSSRQLSAGWGKTFKVEWIKVARLPFSRTRHIRNQFNAGREVKISRDGTELEPSAGEALLSAFFELEEGVEQSPDPDQEARDVSDA